MPGPLLRLSAVKEGVAISHRNNGSLMIHQQRGPSTPAFSSVYSASAYKERLDLWFEHPQHPPHNRHILSNPSNLSMAQSTSLKHFDPFATHPFTNNNALQRHPPPAPPSKYPRPIPSSVSQYTAGTPAHMQTPRQSSSTPNTIHSPEPRRPIPLVNSHQSSNPAHQRQKAVFTLFQQDRSSPELEEILLRKKLTQALGSVALGPDGKHDGYPSS